MIPQKQISSPNRVHYYSFSTPLNSIYTVIIMSLGESHIVYDEFETMQTNKFVTTILYVLYLIIVSLLLVNMLIAMMANTYTTANEKRQEWVRQWAKMILDIEQNVNVKTRLREQNKYTNLMISGERDLVVKWRMTVSVQWCLVFFYYAGK
jgi:transient receptor potential cation channel subfamily V protein 5